MQYERRKDKEKDERLFNGTAVNHTEKCTKKETHRGERKTRNDHKEGKRPRTKNISVNFTRPVSLQINLYT